METNKDNQDGKFLNKIGNKLSDENEHKDIDPSVNKVIF